MRRGGHEDRGGYNDRGPPHRDSRDRQGGYQDRSDYGPRGGFGSRGDFTDRRGPPEIGLTDRRNTNSGTTSFAVRSCQLAQQCTGLHSARLFQTMHRYPPQKTFALFLLCTTAFVTALLAVAEAILWWFVGYSEEDSTERWGHKHVPAPVQIPRTQPPGVGAPSSPEPPTERKRLVLAPRSSKPLEGEISSAAAAPIPEEAAADKPRKVGNVCTKV